MPSKYRIIALIVIIAVAIFFRFWQFTSIPPGLYQDEAMNGADALSSLKNGDFKVFYQNNNGREGMIIWLDALAIKAFGAKSWVLRLFPALAGVLAVLGLYFLAKSLFNPEVALASSFFMAVSFWAVNFSRIGFRANLMLPFLIWSFYFLLRGFKTENKIYNFIAAGILFGLGFYTYISYRFAPVLALWFLPAAIKKKSKKLWLGIFIFIAAAFIVALPIGLYFLKNPGDFFGRASGISILSQKSPILSGALNIVKTLQMFNFVGDLNWRHNFAGSPELFLPVGLLFLLGIYLSFKRFGFGEKFLLGWFLIFLFPNFLATEGNPHALRALGAMPAAMIFSGLGFIWLYQKMEERLETAAADPKFLGRRGQLTRIKKEIFWLFVVFLIFVAGLEFNKYFNRWTFNLNVATAFSKNQVVIADYLNGLPQNIKKYVIWSYNDRPTDDSLPVSAQTIYFLTIEKSRLRPRFAKATPGEQGFDGQVNYLKSDELDKIKLGENGTVIAPIYFDMDLMHNLNKKFPKSKIEFIDLNTPILIVP